METPCQRPETLEGRRSDLERGTNATGCVVGSVLVLLLGVYSGTPQNKQILITSSNKAL